MSLFFISDLHLDPKRPAITQAFYHFLDTTAQQAEALYILGDFFEAWLGDDDDTPLYQDVIQRLHRYSTQGHPLYFMHGNRDFLVGNAFAQRCNATLINDPHMIHYAGSDYLLMHGDSLCTKDITYMEFRAMARSNAWQQQFLQQPLSQRRQIVADIQAKSQSMKSLKAADIMDVTHEEVVKIMDKYQVNTLIHGHTHRPNTHQLVRGDNTSAERWVLGDWETKGWYIEISDRTDGHQRPTLRSFDIG